MLYSAGTLYHIFFRGKYTCTNNDRFYVRYQMYRFIPYIERKEIIEIGKKERKRARGALPPAFPASFWVYGGVYGLAPPYLYKK